MALGGGGGFIPEPDLALGGSSGGGGGKRKYSTRMLDDLMVLSRAEGAGDANGEAGASGAAGSTARRPQSQGDAQEAAQAQQQPYSDAGDDALYAELIQLSDTSVALQMLRTQVTPSSPSPQPCSRSTSRRIVPRTMLLRTYCGGARTYVCTHSLAKCHCVRPRRPLKVPLAIQPSPCLPQFLQAAGKWEDRPAPVALATQLYAVVRPSFPFCLGSDQLARSSSADSSLPTLPAATWRRPRVRRWKIGQLWIVPLTPRRGPGGSVASS